MIQRKLCTVNLRDFIFGMNSGVMAALNIFETFVSLKFSVVGAQSSGIVLSATAANRA